MNNERVAEFTRALEALAATAKRAGEAISLAAERARPAAEALKRANRERLGR